VAQVRSVTRALPIREVKTLARQRDETVSNERLLATVGGFFGVLALLLAAIGVYGVVAYSVARRVPELGLRIALGAGRSALIWLVLRGALLLVAIGLVIGLSAALTTSRLLSSVLYGIRPDDSWVYVAATAILLIVAVAATLVPALRASAIHPAAALRNE
jgi:ABC-type antimicrobial peptide transport system permease subunit